ncbi:disease resistance protein RPM1 [Apium graveolens]|uniref:disease resistance protein RPM1 n=1 Tax=Apium graveolens TaxID=4045 RepID=UPI003D799605
MADGAVQFLLDKLTTILYQQASLLGDAHNEIVEIKLELESMKSFLEDAERRKHRSELVETWVRQVREVASEVEDVIDEFMHYKDTRKDRKGFKHFVQDVIDSPKHMSSRHQISSKLKKIKAEVCEVSDRSKRYAFDKSVDEGRRRHPPDDWWQHHGESSIFDGGDEIVGMEEDKTKLLAWLEDANPRRTVISIVGMGGLGKTTLVTRIYNEQVTRDFDCWVWISVSRTDEFEIDELLRSMIKEFLGKKVMVPSNLGSMDYRHLVEMLIDILHLNRYFVVLDDVWSIDLWSRIRGAFPDNGRGSRILFTTRNENVAKSVGPGSHVHRIEPLKEDDAWSLFCRKAFWSSPDRNCPSELESSARFILKKCEGLPLAIGAIGGLMCSRNKLAVEWKKVCDSLNWQLSNNPMLERVKGILLLSFNDLPYNLKHCFLYCCVFRDGYPIKRKKLIRLWVAEGFVLEQKGMTMEEVAEDYLTELIYRSMIHVTETNDVGRVKTFRLHDVMRELAMTTSQKENLCAEYDGRDSRLEEKIQRLSVYHRGENIQLSKNTSYHLRSLFVFPTDACSSFSLSAMSSRFRLLRVLDLQGVNIETVPGTLVNLFNLRYLNLRETKVKELPKSMEALRNLQTLDLRDTGVKKLPKDIPNMQKLCHLFLGCNMNYNLDSSGSCHGLPVPAGIGRIRDLQTLTCVEANEQLIQQLSNLTDLRRLDITKLRPVSGEKLCTSIQKMTNLCRLSVVASEDQELVLDNLTIPPLFLQKLTLIGGLKRLPPWLELLDSLTHLHLVSSHIKDDLLSSLQKLPALVFLELNKAHEGNVLCFKKHGFPKLVKLKLRELLALESVRLEEGTLRCIKELHLIHCPELKVLPQGIENLTSLQSLKLEAMPDEIVQRLETDFAEKHSSKARFIS